MDHACFARNAERGSQKCRLWSHKKEASFADIDFENPRTPLWAGAAAPLGLTRHARRAVGTHYSPTKIISTVKPLYNALQYNANPLITLLVVSPELKIPPL